MTVCDTFDSTILGESETENCIFSPDSAFTLFSLLYDVYDEDTQQEINSWFNNKISEDPKIDESPDIFDGELQKISKLFLRAETQLPMETKNKLGKKCDIEIVDVTDPTSFNSILNWSKENASDPTCNLFPSPSLNNIINFNFQWANSFHDDNTTKKTFYRSNTTSTKHMIQTSNYGYKNDEELDAHIFEIPFSNESVSMIIVVPKKKNNLSLLENKLRASYALEKLSQIEKHPMKLSIPKFRFNKTFNIKDIFQKNHNKNFPYKLLTFSPSHMGEMLTTASIEVDENGVKATAASAFELILDTRIKEMTFETSIANRFAKTLVTNKWENLENISQEATFSMMLPEDAFISEFVMVIKEKSYKAYVKEKEEAKHIYDEAVVEGRGAAHVAVTARDSNRFTVSVNIEPFSEATFLLTYEELLQRRLDQYELVLNIYPGHVVDTLNILVKINECRQLRYVKTPAIRSGNELANNSEPNSLTEIDILDSTAVIKFEPNIKYQKQIARQFDKPEHFGFCGQFVIQYDVELDPSNGEILVSDGYFVHFYAPDDLPPLAKHVVFTLDTSGSMGGRKIEQLQDAMQCILDQIQKHDLVDILEFTGTVTVYDLATETPTVIDYEMEENYYEPFYKYERLNLPGAKPANENIIEKAKNVVKRMRPTNSTHMIGGLETALYLVKIGQERYSNYQPIIIFLTDGEPNTGMGDTNEITRVVTKLNQKNNKAPIFSLSFGEGADKNFLRMLSLDNFGFSKHIYEASDASLQLQQFYKHISSPLLSNVIFKYDSNVEDATKNCFPIYFRGSDIVLCGRYTDFRGPNCVNLVHLGGSTVLRPTINESVTPIERLWAYLTVKQILNQRQTTDNTAELTKKAVELAIKYSFVTEVTSLVVIKPHESSTVNTEGVNLNSGSINFEPNSKFEQMSGRLSRPSLGSYLSTEVVRLSKKLAKNVVELTKAEKFYLPTEFKIDHPFLIMIQVKLKKRNVILFMGRLLEPVHE